MYGLELYVGTQKSVENNILSPGNENKYWATSVFDYAWAYSVAPKGRSRFLDSPEEWYYRFPKGERNNGFIYRISYPEVYNKEGNIEYTSKHMLASHVELIGRSNDYVV